MAEADGRTTMDRPQRWATPFGADMTPEDVDALLDVLPGLVARLRAMPTMARVE